MRQMVEMYQMQSPKRYFPYTQEFIEAEAEALEKWMQQTDSIYLKGFAFDRGYSPQRLPEFAESNKRFAEVLARAREWQEIRLVEGGLLDEFNAVNPLAFILKSIDGKSRELVEEIDV